LGHIPIIPFIRTGEIDFSLVGNSVAETLMLTNREAA